MKFLRKTIPVLGCCASLLVFLWGCVHFEQTADIALFAVPWGVVIARYVFASTGTFMTVGFLILAFAGAKYWSFLVCTFRTRGRLGYVLIGFHLVGTLVQLASRCCYHNHHSLLIDGLEMLSFGVFLLFLKESVKRCSQ